MLKRCEDTNLSLNWEKSHFMVKEGIVLGHKISKSGIEVDRAKVECIESFNTLKRKLTEAPILIAPDWDLPFELMCDASDFAIGARRTHAVDPIAPEFEYWKLETKKGSRKIFAAGSSFTTGITHTKISSRKDFAFTTMRDSLLSRELIRRLFRGKKLWTFSKLASVDPTGGHLVPITQQDQERSLTQDSIGLKPHFLLTRMPHGLCHRCGHLSSSRKNYARDVDAHRLHPPSLQNL
ncbi:retrovirus-related pol polyprotein from transposon 17.6 [Tanacetum coccineum]